MLSLILHTSTKKDGNMSFRYDERDEVVKNRERFLAKHGISIKDCVAMSLLHGIDCVVATSHDKGSGMLEPRGIESDCVITREKNLFLFLLTGDCLPVAIHDSRLSVVALGHFSRHNASQKFISSIVKILEDKFECEANNLIVTIGPGIHQKSYLHTKVTPQSDESAWQPFIHKSGDGVTVDLPGFVVRQLIGAGIPKEHITVSTVDTAASRDYFSHYRSARTGELEGRFVTIMGIK